MGCCQQRTGSKNELRVLVDALSDERIDFPSQRERELDRFRDYEICTLIRKLLDNAIGLQFSINIRRRSVTF